MKSLNYQETFDLMADLHEATIQGEGFSPDQAELAAALRTTHLRGTRFTVKAIVDYAEIVTKVSTR